MIIKYLINTGKLTSILFLILTATFSCKKMPEPGFTYEPAQNPEAGDTIKFNNTSVNASTFEWEFGDGTTSNLNSPIHIFNEAGIFDVKLTALNDKGSEFITESLTINEPTIMGIQVFAAEDTSVLEDTQVMLYDNEEDFLNFATEDPQYLGITDVEGYVEFTNMEPIIYYMVAIKVEEAGYWGFLGEFPQALEQNEYNGFWVLCPWFNFEEKKSTGLPSFEGGQILRIRE
jgi:hypothetical protein